MKGNPEDAVIAEINALEADALIDSQLAHSEAPADSLPTCRCGRPWHGLPRNGCPGSHQTAERDHSKESAGVVYVDEIYQLSNVRRGLMQVIPSAFAVNHPISPRESVIREFLEGVNQMVDELAGRGGESDSMVIISGYDSNMQALLAADDGLASRHRTEVGTEDTPPLAGQLRGSWTARIRRLLDPR